MIKNDFYSEDEICAFLNMNKAGLARLRKEKGLPFVRVTRNQRIFLHSELLAWFQKNNMILTENDSESENV